MPGIEADGAHQVPAAGLGVALDQIRQRRAALARHPLGHPLHREPDGLLGEEHQRRPPLLGRGHRDQQGHGDLLRILQPRRQADNRLAAHVASCPRPGHRHGRAARHPPLRGSDRLRWSKDYLCFTIGAMGQLPHLSVAAARCYGVRGCRTACVMQMASRASGSGPAILAGGRTGRGAVAFSRIRGWRRRSRSAAPRSVPAGAGPGPWPAPPARRPCPPGSALRCPTP